ncbi:MAG: hypothetical protein EA402_10995 [Planctomycetota bacterium]|nr:MAG: hypothetical protein EA402_10995 [Planctomycetota bacterium]
MDYVRLALAILLAASLGSVACGRSDQRRAEQLLGADRLSIENAQGIGLEVKGIRQNKRRVILSVDLYNEGSASLRFKPLEDPQAISLQALGRQIAHSPEIPGLLGIWTGYYEGEVEVQGHRLLLSPGGRIGLRLHFPWPDGGLERHDYPWELQLGGLRLGDEASLLPALNISGP